MKKGTIIALGVAGGLVILGLILGIAAVLFGANPVTLFTDGSYVIHTNGMSIGISSNGNYKDDSAPVEAGHIYTVDDEINSVYVGWVSGSVRVEPSTDGRISFYEESSIPITENTALGYTVNGGKLSIDWDKENTVIGFGFGLENPDKHLVLCLPESVKQLRVGAASADVELSSLNLEGGINISTASGDILVQETYAHSVSLDAASGDITFSGECNEYAADTASGKSVFSGKCTKFDVDSASGDVKAVFLEMPRETDIETASGSVELTLPENADFELEFDTASGDLNSEHPLSMRDGDYYCGSGRNEISVDTASGNLTIK